MTAFALGIGLDDWLTNMNDRPFDQGFAAYAKGRARDDCPFRHGSLEHDQWVAGWDYAKALLAKKPRPDAPCDRGG